MICIWNLSLPLLTSSLSPYSSLKLEHTQVPEMIRCLLHWWKWAMRCMCVCVCARAVMCVIEGKRLRRITTQIRTFCQTYSAWLVWSQSQKKVVSKAESYHQSLSSLYYKAASLCFCLATVGVMTVTCSDEESLRHRCVMNENIVQIRLTTLWENRSVWQNKCQASCSKTFFLFSIINIYGWIKLLLHSDKSLQNTLIVLPCILLHPISISLSVWKAPAVHNQSSTKKYRAEISQAERCKNCHCCFNAKNMCRDDAVLEHPRLWDHMQGLWPWINSNCNPPLRCTASDHLSSFRHGKQSSSMMRQRRTAGVRVWVAGVN